MGLKLNLGEPWNVNVPVMISYHQFGCTEGVHITVMHVGSLWSNIEKILRNPI